MNLRACSKLRERTGQSLVELALILPLLVVLVAGIVDVSRAIQVHNAIVNISREGVNLASRTALLQQQEESVSAQMVMNSLANTEKSLSMKKHGMMYLTKIENKTGTPEITQQYPWEQNSSGPKTAVESSTLAKVLGEINLAVGERAWVFEVFYSYDSIFVPQSSAENLPPLHSLAIL